MNPGKLNERIILKTPASSSLDNYGQSLMTYTTGSIWAAVKMESGAEVNNGGYIGVTANYTFTVRHTGSITEKCSLTYKNNEYNITFIQEEPTRMYMLLSTERRN
jgi:SPP1 family predicted phage head-tail adaptor